MKLSEELFVDSLVRRSIMFR